MLVQITRNGECDYINRAASQKAQKEKNNTQTNTLKCFHMKASPHGPWMPVNALLDMSDILSCLFDQCNHSKLKNSMAKVRYSPRVCLYLSHSNIPPVQEASRSPRQSKAMPKMQRIIFSFVLKTEKKKNGQQISKRKPRHWPPVLVFVLNHSRYQSTSKRWPDSRLPRFLCWRAQMHDSGKWESMCVRLVNCAQRNAWSNRLWLCHSECQWQHDDQPHYLLATRSNGSASIFQLWPFFFLSPLLFYFPFNIWQVFYAVFAKLKAYFRAYQIERLSFHSNGLHWEILWMIWTCTEAMLALRTNHLICTLFALYTTNHWTEFVVSIQIWRVSLFYRKTYAFKNAVIFYLSFSGGNIH